ncbi:hypothetical protein [Caballeronia sp. LZ016]|uniref:hypothetical protein n=1 Tax=Caballeronia sp. LZ016 TaxID=3038554 RepID=UPI0028554AC0|nr:hypothetical protein [Caballeronia sp. LZ016]MDR5740084.1 hypothetical protein [Caballeronia sp. LZ016]
MTGNPESTHRLHLQRTAHEVPRYIDANRTCNVATDCDSPATEEAAAVAAGVQTEHAGVRRLSRVYHCRMLEKADRDIVRARERIREQMDRTARLERDGHDAAQSGDLLPVFSDALHAMLERRQVIVEQIDPLKARDRVAS